MQFSGIVIHGDGYGKKLGFPTANIDTADFVAQNLTLEEGVYVGCVQIEDDTKWHKAGIVIGPLQSDGHPKLEAHLIDFSGDLYGSVITFYIGAFIRPFTTYTTEAELVAMITADIEHIKNLPTCLPE